MIAELFRIVSATQNSQELERKRRLAWEQEQEAKVTQVQANMEQKMQDMFNEITSLRSAVNTLTSSPSSSPPTNASSPQFNMSPFMAQQINPYFQPASPISPVSQHSTYQPIFVQGSSNGSLPSANQNTYQVGQVVRPQMSQLNHAPPCLEESPRLDVQLPHQATSPDPSPQLTSLETSTPSSSSGLHLKGKRRRKSVKPIDDESSSSNSSSSDSAISRNPKRSNHHDTRCYTIQVSSSFLLQHMFRYSVFPPVLSMPCEITFAA